MNLAEYLKQQGVGAQAKLAKQINSNQMDISLWAREKRQVPIKRCIRIEKATNGAVTRKDLRPNDYHEIWTDIE